MTPQMKEAIIPGRSCPTDYRYGAVALNRAADFSAETLYVVGGLYGNRFALEALLALRRLEPDAQLAFNGDFNWFNRDDASFEAVNTEVLRHRAIRGNVETELLSPDAAAGCGCGYPDYVSDADVARSNAIMGSLSATAQRHRALSERLVALPMHLVAQVGALRVGIVHGDADSLAGWSFGEEAIEGARVAALFEAAQVRAFASSHTCLPVGETFVTRQGVCALFNNGAAGMPNFADSSFGLITRISTRAAPEAVGSVYGVQIDGVYLDSVPLHYDQQGWLAHFDRVWPAASPASLSYRQRIVSGPRYTLDRAVRGEVRLRRRASVSSEPTYKSQDTAAVA